MVFVNSSGVDQTLTLTLKRSTGVVVNEGVQKIVPAKGYAEVALEQYESANNYGVVTVQGATRAISSWVLRERGNEYLIPTPVRE